MTLTRLQFVPAYVAPEAWATPTTAWDVRAYATVKVQFVTTPSTPYQPVSALDGTNFANCLAYDEQGNSFSTISAAGTYLFPWAAGGYLKFSAGAGSTLTRQAGA